MTSRSPRKRRTTAFPTTPRRTAISLAALVGLCGAAAGQSVVPAAPPVAPVARTTWAPAATTPPATPSVPPAAKLPDVPATPIAAPPGLVPKTLTFQKESGTTAPALPAAPLTFQKSPGETVAAPAVPAVPLTFQKEAGATGPLPPLTVPAVPTAMARLPQDPKPADPKPQDPPKKGDDETTRKEVPKAPDRQPELTKGTLPTRENVFRLTADAELNARIQKELGNRTDPFPTPAPLSAEPLVYQPKTLTYPAMRANREPNYVVHRRLYFEEPNAERAGWDLGPLQSALSTAYFMKDVVFLPHNVASGLWKNRWDTSAGKCPPGAMTPYYLYPPRFTVSGLMFESTLITGLVFIIP